MLTARLMEIDPRPSWLPEGFRSLGRLSGRWPGLMPTWLGSLLLQSGQSHQRDHVSL